MVFGRKVARAMHLAGSVSVPSAMQSTWLPEQGWARMAACVAGEVAWTAALAGPVSLPTPMHSLQSAKQRCARMAAGMRGVFTSTSMSIDNERINIAINPCWCCRGGCMDYSIGRACLCARSHAQPTGSRAGPGKDGCHCDPSAWQNNRPGREGRECACPRLG